MVEAIVEQFGTKVDLSVAPTGFPDYLTRAQLGLYQTLHVHRFPRLSANLGGYAHPELRRRFGLVADHEISGVLDASGFAYSDSFGVKRSQQEALFGRRWHRRGVPKVMLPQAFGPFKNEAVARWAREVLNQADVVFVRDEVSQSHLKSLSIDTQTILAPDFTIGLKPIATDVPVSASYAAIVPNMRLVTQGVVSEANYVAHFVALGQAARTFGLSPLVVIHEASDKRIGSLIAEQLAAPTFVDDRPLALKGAIAGASLLIASRFHAVVGGLSQSVRTIAIGWSHKYGALMEDFGVPEWQSDLTADPYQTVKRILDDEGGLSRVQDARISLVGRLDSMWQVAEEILNIQPLRAEPASMALEHEH